MEKEEQDALEMDKEKKAKTKEKNEEKGGRALALFSSCFRFFYVFENFVSLE